MTSYLNFSCLAGLLNKGETKTHPLSCLRCIRTTGGTRKGDTPKSKRENAEAVSSCCILDLHPGDLPDVRPSEGQHFQMKYRELQT